jgi:hypothetical protein
MLDASYCWSKLIILYPVLIREHNFSLTNNLKNGLQERIDFITTNKCTIIYQQHLFIIYTSTCFDISVMIREFLHLRLSKLHKFLNLKLLKLQFNEIIKIY